MRVKRCFDALLASFGLVILLPILVVVALIIQLDSPGPALYGQSRVGRNGRLFTIWKFRTMWHGCVGAPLALEQDPRITRMGRWLRTYRIDELPQLFNVIVGDMSLVGPRPEVPKYVATYPDDVRRQVLSVRPGITDRAAIAFRNEAALLANASDSESAYVQHILPEKLRYHLAYVEDRSFLGDLRIMLETIGVVAFRNRG